MPGKIPEGWMNRAKIVLAVFILLFWVVTPLVAARFGYSSIDVSFWITMFYAVVFGTWKLAKRFELID